ncbi:MAG: hypothetical protein AAGK97_17010, partial [Bacteroidota bacterium]
DRFQIHIMEYLEYIGLPEIYNFHRVLYILHIKFLGLLIQNVLLGSEFNASVLGIGINVNQKFFPDHLPNPTSIFLESGQILDIPKFNQHLFHCVEKKYLSLKKGGFKEIHKNYLEQLYRKDKMTSFFYNQNSIQGIIRGVNGMGKLELEMKDGSLRLFNFNELKYNII